MLTNTRTELVLDRNQSLKFSKTRLKIKEPVKMTSVLVVTEDAYEKNSDQGKFIIINFENAIHYLTSIHSYTIDKPEMILVSSNLGEKFGKHLPELKAFCHSNAVPLVLYSPGFSKLSRNIAIKFGFDEYYFGDFTKVFLKKIRFYKKLKVYRCKGTS